MNKKRFANATEVTLIHNIFTALGPNTRITRQELEQQTGLHIRVVRDAISQLVKWGIPIISDRDGGYEVSTDRAKIEREMTRLRSQAKEINSRGDGLQDYLDRAGQRPLEALETRPVQPGAR